MLIGLEEPPTLARQQLRTPSGIEVEYAHPRAVCACCVERCCTTRQILVGENEWLWPDFDPTTCLRFRRRDEQDTPQGLELYPLAQCQLYRPLFLMTKAVGLLDEIPGRGIVSFATVVLDVN